MHPGLRIPRLSTPVVSSPQNRLFGNTLPRSRRFTSSPSSLATQPPPPASGTGDGNKPQLSAFTRPIAKCFLGAMLTYQILYWTWLRLETDETKANKDAELARLEEEVRRRTSEGS